MDFLKSPNHCEFSKTHEDKKTQPIATDPNRKEPSNPDSSGQTRIEEGENIYRGVGGGAEQREAAETLPVRPGRRRR